MTKMAKQRDISIDILKFFAVLLITNSHMGLLYGKYSILSSGQAVRKPLSQRATDYVRP